MMNKKIKTLYISTYKISGIAGLESGIPLNTYFSLKINILVNYQNFYYLNNPRKPIWVAFICYL